MKKSESHSRKTEVNEADEVSIKSTDETEVSVNYESDAEEDNDQLQQDIDDLEEDISEQLKNLIMESQRNRADWDQRKGQPSKDIDIGPS